jgi:uncharacterized protein YjbI with pentapeptide repeats
MASEEQLAILRQGPAAWNAWLKEHHPDIAIRADLAGADLGKPNPFKADLARADLRGANLVMANLVRADFRGRPP